MLFIFRCSSSDTAEERAQGGNGWLREVDLCIGHLRQLVILTRRKSPYTQKTVVHDGGLVLF